MSSQHHFHIPVMGTGFTLDTPIKVAPYGITSVVSLVDDEIIESTREYYCMENDLPYSAIDKKSENARERRITAYLDLMDELIQTRFQAILASPWEEGSELWKTLEMLPEGELKERFQLAKTTSEKELQTAMIEEIKSQLQPGEIQVNIMTKLDGPEKFAQTALRGFAKSKISGSMVFSAGMNPALFGVLEEDDAFRPDPEGQLKKKIIIKVSDYRSAMIQGKMLARKGFWVSEFRVESGINCGGHAFPSEGILLGPILQEFVDNRSSLEATLSGTYEKSGAPHLSQKKFQITVQGGIGTHQEDLFLREHFGVEATGWGSAFLFVPEVVNMDQDQIQLMVEADEDDIYLSGASPLGIPFWNIKGSESEMKRLERIANQSPGAPCPKGYLALSTEFPPKILCPANKEFQKQKLEKIAQTEASDLVKTDEMEKVKEVACICHDLGGSLNKKLGLAGKFFSALTPGPTSIYMRGASTLKEMVSHIYGRINLLGNKIRPHMFLKELELYIKYLGKRGARISQGLLDASKANLTGFVENLSKGIHYYQDLANHMYQDTRESFFKGLEHLKDSLSALTKHFKQQEILE